MQGHLLATLISCFALGMQRPRFQISIVILGRGGYFVKIPNKIDFIWSP